jgi:hypothetical protein
VRDEGDIMQNYVTLIISELVVWTSESAELSVDDVVDMDPE